jgi:hypothetical protein
LPILPSLGLHARLAGHRVLENGLVGDTSAESLACFVKTICGLLKRGESDGIFVQDLDVNDPLRAAVMGAAKEHNVGVCCPSQPTAHWWIRFPEKPEQYWEQFSKKSRYNFRYRAKHLEHTLRCVRDPAEVMEYIQQVRELSHKTWQHHRLQRAIYEQKNLELCQQMALAGGLRSYVLMQGKRPIAYATCFQWKGRFVYEETGFDPAFAAKSPGQVLLYRIIEDLIARQTPSLFDFGFGDSEYKRIFANHQTLSGPVVLVRQALWPLAQVRAAQLRSMTGRGMRKLLAKAKILPRLRHIHRGFGRSE